MHHRLRKNVTMKVPSTTSILLASLAVSSSSSALIPTPPDTHQGAPLSSGSSALIASSSSGSLAPQQTGSSQHELVQESIEQRAILDDILPVACQLAHTLTDNLPAPVPGLVALLCSPSTKDGKGSTNQAKAHKELSRISDTLQQAVFVPGAPVPPPSAPTPVAASDGTAEDNGRVGPINSASLFPSSYGSSAPLMSSASSTAWRVQPTPANSPSLPVDDPEES